MDRRVNERQLEVLRWVADGCSEDRWPENDFTHRTSAAALKSRGLISIAGRGRTWSATITEAGTHFLEHGTYPAAPLHQPQSPQIQALSSQNPRHFTWARARRIRLSRRER